MLNTYSTYSKWSSVSCVFVGIRGNTWEYMKGIRNTHVEWPCIPWEYVNSFRLHANSASTSRPLSFNSAPPTLRLPNHTRTERNEHVVGDPPQRLRLFARTLIRGRARLLYAESRQSVGVRFAPSLLRRSSNEHVRRRFRIVM